jgi:hypothetical protein
MAQQFESAMKLIADTNDPNQPVPDRYAVTGTGLSGGGGSSGGSSGGSGSGSGTASWIPSGGWNVAESHYNNLKTSGTWDIWWQGWWRDAGWNYEVVVAANLNDSWFSASADPWQQFSLGPQYILNNITSSPWQSDVFSPSSFYYAGTLVGNLAGLIQSWQQSFHQWADDVDVSGSDWQGSAAGVFKHTLQTFESQLGALNAQLTPPSLGTALTTLQQNMASYVSTLSQAFFDWHGKPENMPANVVNALLQNTMNSSQVTMHYHGISHGHPTPTISTPLGDPTKQAFWDALESQAKQNWLATLAPLDTAAATFLQSIEQAYQGVIAVLPTTYAAPPVLNPGSGGTNGGTGGSGGNDGTNIPNINVPNLNLGNPNGSNGSAGSNGAGGGGGNGPAIPNLDLGNPNGSSGSGGGAGAGGGPGVPGGLQFSSSGSGSPGGGPAGLPSVLTGLPDTTADFSSSGSTGAGGAETVTGPDGSPVLGPDGLPVTAPAGSTIGPGGEVIGPNGKPVLGPDGEPLTVPQGSTLAPETGLTTTTPLTTTGGSGDPAPPGDLALGGSTGAPGLVTTGGGAGGSFGAIGGSKGSSPFGSGGVPGGPGTSTARLLGSTGGMSDRAANMFDDSGSPSEPATTGETPAELEAAQAAAEGEQALSRVSTVGGTGASGDQTPFMPPMTGGMGAGGGGGAGAAKKTWVTEDEDTWGTASTGTGVIGRR